MKEMKGTTLATASCVGGVLMGAWAGWTFTTGHPIAGVLAVFAAALWVVGAWNGAKVAFYQGMNKVLDDLRQLDDPWRS